MSFNADVYRTQGAKSLVITSSGRIEEAVETVTTTTSLIASGLSLIGTSTGAQTYTLAAPPAAGVRKQIICVASTSTGLTHTVNTNSTGVGVNVAGNNTLTFNANDEAVTLMSSSTDAWRIISNVGSVGTGTQST